MSVSLILLGVCIFIPKLFALPDTGTSVKHSTPAPSHPTATCRIRKSGRFLSPAALKAVVIPDSDHSTSSLHHAEYTSSISSIQRAHSTLATHSHAGSILINHVEHATSTSPTPQSHSSLATHSHAKPTVNNVMNHVEHTTLTIPTSQSHSSLAAHSHARPTSHNVSLHLNASKTHPPVSGARQTSPPTSNSDSSTTNLALWADWKNISFVYSL